MVAVAAHHHRARPEFGARRGVRPYPHRMPVHRHAGPLSHHCSIPVVVGVHYYRPAGAEQLRAGGGYGYRTRALHLEPHPHQLGRHVPVGDLGVGYGGARRPVVVVRPRGQVYAPLPPHPYEGGLRHRAVLRGVGPVTAVQLAAHAQRPHYPDHLGLQLVEGPAAHLQELVSGDLPHVDLVLLFGVQLHGEAVAVYPHGKVHGAALHPGRARYHVYLRVVRRGAYVPGPSGGVRGRRVYRVVRVGLGPLKEALLLPPPQHVVLYAGIPGLLGHGAGHLPGHPGYDVGTLVVSLVYVDAHALHVVRQPGLQQPYDLGGQIFHGGLAPEQVRS